MDTFLPTLESFHTIEKIENIVFYEKTSRKEGSIRLFEQQIAVFDSAYNKSVFQINLYEDAEKRTARFFTTIVSNAFLNPKEISEVREYLAKNLMDNASKILILNIDSIEFLDIKDNPKLKLNENLIFDESLMSCKNVNPYILKIEYSELTPQVIGFFRNLNITKHELLLQEESVKQVYYFKEITGNKLIQNLIGLTKIKTFLNENNISCEIVFAA